MAKSEEERPFRLRPGKPKLAAGKSSNIGYSSGFKLLMHYARQSRRGTRSTNLRPSQPYQQRCAVRITYSRNAVRGQWRAHGRYLERESALDGQTAFDGEHTEVEIVSALQRWQIEKDELLWKMIVSPEFGDRVDLQRLTRDLMQRVEQDVGFRLEWVAAVHQNTEHPHAHVAVRGIANGGQAVRFSKDYVKHGFRDIAQDLCTRQLGFRTTLDAIEAERREIFQHRFTSIDRKILQHSTSADAGFAFELKRGEGREAHTSARLVQLQRMDLARRLGPGAWLIRTDTEQVLRAMQRTADRQKTMMAHGELVSDSRMPIEVIDWRRTSNVAGRVLVHGQEEQSGRNYLMLESTAGAVYYIPYSREMEELRAEGGLKSNSFVRLRKLFSDGKSATSIKEIGDAEAVLSDREHLREKVQHLISTETIPTDDGWSGWLGRYQRAILEEFERLFEMDPRYRRSRRASLDR